MTTKAKKGFSLLEMLVYIAIFAFLSIIIMNTLATVTHLGTTETSRESATRSALTVISRLDQDIKSAQGVWIDQGNLVLDGRDEDLSLYLEDGVTLTDLSYSLISGSTSVEVESDFSLGSESFHLVTVQRHK
jgi:prepilin-type N-terminal cleavage/methylation domain-containing protein